MKPLDPRLLRLSRSARWAVAASVLTGIVRTAATIGIAWAIAATVTEAIDADHVSGLGPRIAPTLTLLAAAFVVRAVAAWATDDLAARAAATVKGELRRTVLRRAADRGPEWLAQRSSAGFATTLGPGLDALDAYFGRFLPQLVLTAIATPVLVVSIWLGDATSGVIVLCTLPVIPAFMILIGLATQSLQRRQQDALARLGGAFLEAVEGLATLKLFGRARRQTARIGTITDEYRRGTLGVLRLSFVSGFALELAASLSVALVAISIGVRLIDGSLGLGAALFVLVLAPEAFAPIRQVGADFHAASDGVEASTAVLDLLDDADENGAGENGVGEIGAGENGAGENGVGENGVGENGVGENGVGENGAGKNGADEIGADESGADEGLADEDSACGDGVPAPPWARQLVLSGLRVRRGDREIGPLDVRLEPGTIAALTGPSGSGKTTLLAAMRGVTAHEGAVTLGAEPSLQAGAGLDVADVTWMDQRPRLVAGTVADNVALGADADAGAVAAAIDATGLDVSPDTVLGAGGSGLSGGQAQRVALARALFRASSTATPVVLLDEPTSALDADAEQRAVATVRDLASRGAVVVVASHRPAVVAAASVRIPVDAFGAVRVERHGDDGPAADTRLADARGVAR